MLLRAAERDDADPADIVLAIVGTAKRERQKANKARREQEELRAQSKKRTMRIAFLVGGAIIAVFIIVAVAGRFFIDDDDDNGLIGSGIQASATTQIITEIDED